VWFVRTAVPRKERTSRAARQAHGASRANKALHVGLPVLLMAALALAACFVLFPNDKPALPAPGASTNAFGRAPGVARKARTLEELLAMSPQQLAEVDVAEMNLLCATGLPGSEDLDVDRCLAALDRWAGRVKSETDRHFYKFARDPGSYRNSEGYFRMLMLITVLQQDFGVRYNVRRVRDIDFRRSQDLFIHGMIGSGNGGTCVSMPVLYAAVARRLGYPVRLVLAKAHVFCRWDSPAERFNIEATNQGMNSFPDEYYLAWPEKVSRAEAGRNRYLLSLSPGEELASFLGCRGHCLLDNGRAREGLDAYAAAHRLAPKDPAYLAWARGADIRLRLPTSGRPGRPGHPAMLYRPRRPDLDRIHDINRANAQRMMLPPVPGGHRPDWPHLPKPAVPPPAPPGTAQPAR
jgi:hypothetical protein